MQTQIYSTADIMHVLQLHHRKNFTARLRFSFCTVFAKMAENFCSPFFPLSIQIKHAIVCIACVGSRGRMRYIYGPVLIW